MPGHASRYATERPVPAAVRSRARHHVIHFREEKIANESVHMKAHAGMYFPARIANAGKTNKGSHPGQIATLA
jgi:hypothetical protein